MKVRYQIKEIAGTIRFIYPRAIAACPGIFWGSNLCGLFSGILIGMQTTITAYFFDSITEMSKIGFMHSVFLGIILGIVVLLNEVINGLMNYLYECVNRKTTAGFMKLLHEKAGKLSPVIYEKAEELDKIEKASKGAEYASKFVADVTGMFTTYIPYIIYMGIFLYFSSRMLAFSLLIIFIPVILNQMIRSHIYSDAEDGSARERRKEEHYRRCLTELEYVKETRMLGKSLFFQNKFRNTLDTLLSIRKNADKKSNSYKLLMALLTLAGYGGVLFLLVLSMLEGKIAVGSFAAIFASIGTMYGIMTEMLEGQLGGIARNFGAVRNYKDFFALPEMNTAGKKLAANGNIEIKNVSFRYPGAYEDALKDVSLTVNSGEIIAVVGENGAGKSTLMKLMMGLYIPDKGTIRVGGEDMTKINTYSIMSAVFQKYQKYQMSLEDNVVISNYALVDAKRVGESLRQAGIMVDKALFPKGTETILSRTFGGKELSGGQWQRVAIARGIYRNHEILFLDEPTAAIDPLEETELYHQFEKLCIGKTAVIITHRMGCTKIANRIVVMKDGRIIETGSHDELYENGACYKKYWESQAGDYQNKEF